MVNISKTNRENIFSLLSGFFSNNFHFDVSLSTSQRMVSCSIIFQKMYKFTLASFLMDYYVHNFISKWGVTELIHFSIFNLCHCMGRCHIMTYFVSLTKCIFLCQNTTHKLPTTTMAKTESVQIFRFPFCRKRPFQKRS